MKEERFNLDIHDDFKLKKNSLVSMVYFKILIFQRCEVLGNNHLTNIIVPLDMKGCICHFVKWQIHPSISKGTI